MNNRQNYFPNNGWNQNQNPSSNYHINPSNNSPFNEVSWHQPENNSNLVNEQRNINNANFPNINIQVGGTSINNSTQDNRFVQSSPSTITANSENNFILTSGQQAAFPLMYNPRMPLQNTSNPICIPTSESNSNYGTSQSISNTSHTSSILTTSNIQQIPFNYNPNQPPPVYTIYNTMVLPCCSSQNSIPLQSDQSFQNQLNISFNIPPPPINNSRISASVVLNQNQEPPLLPPPFSRRHSQIFESSLNHQLPNPPPIMPPSFGPIAKSGESTVISASNLTDWEEEEKLSKFLKKIVLKSNVETRPRNISITKYREVLKEALVTMKNLLICRENLMKLLKADRDIWNAEANQVFFYQHQLDNLCSLLTIPQNIEFVQKRLIVVKKKRDRIKKAKQRIMNEKQKKLKEREELHQEIDKWLDSIKEKNLKLKREAEMKKEADSILSEVRRKILEAKRTIEKLKIFEKLRNARQAKAVNKGLFAPEHDEKFQNSISHLRQTMLRQLVDYEAEEKALKVMLEAEQEGQLEEEAQWKVKRLRSLQRKRQNNIIECLFGDTVEEPSEEDPIFLFYQFQNSGNKNIESLSQIRLQWDVYINESGEPIPQQWVVPVPPSSSGWEVALKS